MNGLKSEQKSKKDGSDFEVIEEDEMEAPAEPGLVKAKTYK